LEVVLVGPFVLVASFAIFVVVAAAAVAYVAA
jgi:hypothetical protein